MKLDTAYWEVRRAIAIVAVFGGLRMAECIDLSLEKISRGPDGFTITHTRSKQRSDKLSTKFMIPKAGGFADMLAVYLDKVKDQLEKYQGRCWYTGRKTSSLVGQFMGRNSIAKVPHEIASLLRLSDPAKYTFHSFRRTSATLAADSGATTEQMVDFFGWKDGRMCKEYISSSKPAIMSMANRLSNSNSEAAGDLNNVIAEMEQDDDMEKEAGIMTSQSTSCQQGVVAGAVKDSLAALANTANCGVNLKVVVINNMSGNITL